MPLGSDQRPPKPARDFRHPSRLSRRRDFFSTGQGKIETDKGETYDEKTIFGPLFRAFDGFSGNPCRRAAYGGYRAGARRAAFFPAAPAAIWAVAAFYVFAAISIAGLATAVTGPFEKRQRPSGARPRRNRREAMRRFPPIDFDQRREAAPRFFQLNIANANDRGHTPKRSASSAVTTCRPAWRRGR